MKGQLATLNRADFADIQRHFAFGDLQILRRFDRDRSVEHDRALLRLDFQLMSQVAQTERDDSLRLLTGKLEIVAIFFSETVTSG